MIERKITLFLMVATLSAGSSMAAMATEVSDTLPEYVSGATMVITENDLDYFKDNANLEQQVMGVYNYAQELKQQGYDSEQIAETINQLLQVEQYSDMDAYISGYLNAQEQELYDQNPAKGLLCMANGKLALGYAQDYYSFGLTDGNGDAFRHTLWNFGMVIDVGYSYAKSWSDAHEYGSSNNTTLAKQMDLYNNRIGLQLGLDYPGTVLHSTFIAKSKDKVHNGKCRRIVNGKLVPTNGDGEI